MPERTLRVNIIGDDRQLKRTFASSQRASQQFGSRMQTPSQTARGFLSGFGGRSSLLFGSGAFIGSAALSAGIRESVTQASNLNEQVNKSREIFGEASRGVERWSETTARSLGIAQAQALTATGTFGNLFRVVDLAPQQAAEMSQALVQLAADLASFNNANPEDVLQAIRSGLIGEAEPLRRYGVLLSEARVQQQAMADTGKTNVKSLTDQEKALARYQIILQDTAPAQGDFARTSDGLANQSRILNANLSDLAGDIGSLLIPKLTEAATTANTLFLAFERLKNFDFGDFGGLRFPDIPFGWREILKATPLVGPLVDPALQAHAALQGLQPGSTLGRPPGTLGGLATSAADRAKKEAAERDRNVKQAQRDLERSRKQFAEFVKGLGLKLDRAGLTQSLDDDLAVLREIERGIQRRIRVEGNTFKLQEQLVRVRLQIQSNLAQQEARADEEIARREEARDRARQRQEEERERRRQAEQNRLRQVQREQFTQLGLTSEGEARAPSVRALRGRLRSIREQLKGTALDTAETRTQLRRIAQVLSGDFGAVGREVRNAILAMFRDINDALEGGGQRRGTQTAFRKANIDKLLSGLGLSPEELKELRARFSQVGAGGRVPGQGQGAFGFATPGGRGGDTYVFNGDIRTDTPDAFIREVQRRARRGYPKRRGVGAGTGMGLK